MYRNEAATIAKSKQFKEEEGRVNDKAVTQPKMKLVPLTHRYNVHIRNQWTIGFGYGHERKLQGLQIADKEEMLFESERPGWA